MRTHRILALAAAAAAMATFTAVAVAVEARSGGRVSITGAFDQLLFAAGDEVVLALTTTDDVVAAGREVGARGATLDHAFLAGREVSFAESTARDVFAAGAEIDVLTGQIADDLVAAGGRIMLGPAARVDSDAVISGGRLRIEAPIGGDLRAAGGVIRLDGPVTGDVYLDGGRIEIGPDARIGGALTHRGRSVEIAPEAQVTGQVTALRPRAEPDFRPLAGLAIWAAAALLFGLFLMAVVIAAAFPRLMNDTADVLRRKPLSMLGLGVLLAVLAPIAIILLIVTLLGAPLAFVLGAAFALLWPLAIVAAVYTGAMLARARMRRGATAPSAGGRALWAGVAMIAFILIGLIPIIGFFVWLLAYLFGLGAVSLTAMRAWAKQPQAS